MNYTNIINRRKFLRFVSYCTCGLIISSCTTVPITERKQFKIIPESTLNKQAEQIYEKVKRKEKLSDDLNISGALGELFSWVSSIFVQLDRETLDYCSANDALSALDSIDTILGVMDNGVGEVNEHIQQLIDARNQARDDKDWAKADEIRNQLYSMDIVLDDTPDGTIWKKK